MLPILLVEDDLSLAQALCTALEPTGIPVEHCQTGELAIELLRAKRYAVIVTELVLSVSGGVSGAYVVKAIKKLPREQRPTVIVLAGDGATFRGLDRTAIAAMLFKPVEFGLFIEYVTATWRRVIGPPVPAEPKTASRLTRSYCGACESPIPAWSSEHPELFDAWLDEPCAGCGMSPRMAGGRSDWIVESRGG